MTSKMEELVQGFSKLMFNRGFKAGEAWAFTVMDEATAAFAKDGEKEIVSNFVETVRSLLYERENNQGVGNGDREVQENQSGSNERTENRDSTVDGD